MCNLPSRIACETLCKDAANDFRLDLVDKKAALIGQLVCDLMLQMIAVRTPSHVQSVALKLRLHAPMDFAACLLALLLGHNGMDASRHLRKPATVVHSPNLEPVELGFIHEGRHICGATADAIRMLSQQNVDLFIQERLNGCLGSLTALECTPRNGIIAELLHDCPIGLARRIFAAVLNLIVVGPLIRPVV
ncbi:hypothetical protein [Mesorhizobium sp. KR2-14]|uniref:hypothetical protein n=1 Tax=Mesorhizobium sp. KR2-14 TaxID=3156610 RepID=UPI0032B488FE